MIGGEDVAPPDRMRAFLVVKSLTTTVTKLNQDQSVCFFVNLGYAVLVCGLGGIITRNWPK